VGRKKGEGENIQRNTYVISIGYTFKIKAIQMANKLQLASHSITTQCPMGEGKSE
jgi:hypothetical protein